MRTIALMALMLIPVGLMAQGNTVTTQGHPLPSKCSFVQVYLLNSTTPWTPYYCNNGTYHAFAAGGGTGTVTSVGNIDLTNLFNCTVSNPTTTPSWTCAFVSTPALPNGSTATTQTSSDNSTKIATDAFVQTAVAGVTSPVTSVFGRTGAVTATSGDYTAAEVTNAAAVNASNTFTTGTQNFKGVTLFEARTSSGLTTTVNGDFGDDTLLANWHVWNGVDSIVGVFAASSLPTDGDCVEWSNSSSKITLADTGSACGSGSGGANALGYYFVSRATDAPVNAINLGAGSAGIERQSVAGGVATVSQSELSGDATTSGSNAVTVSKINGTAFSGTNGHVVDFGASNTPADSGVVGADVVTYHTPATGIARTTSASQAIAGSELSGDATTSGSNAVTVVKVNGGAVPASAAVLGSNSSNQLIAATGHSVVAPLQCADTSSSATTYTCTTTPSLGSLNAGDVFIFKSINQNNSGSSTLNIDAIGAKTIKKWQNTANLASGDLQAGAAVKVTYDGTYLELDTIGNAPSGGGISGLTTGFFPKAASATSLTNSLCDEGITTANVLTCTDTAGAAFLSLSLGSSPPTGCGSATGCLVQTEGSTAGTPTSGEDYMRASSSTHSFVCSLNDGSETACDPLIAGDLGNTPASPQVVSTHLASGLPRNQGGFNSTSAGTGLLRDGTTPTASELSGDATTSGSNVVSVVKTGGVAFGPYATATGAPFNETSTYQVLAADFTNGKTIYVSNGSFTITLVASSSQPASGQYIRVINYGTGIVTIARSSQNINGNPANIVLGPGSSVAPSNALIISDGFNYFATVSGNGIKTIPFQFGTPGGSAISTGVLGYFTVPSACTIIGWSIEVDAGTATVKTLKVASGTAIPTLGSNSISSSGVSISTGTVIQSTTLTDFTTTAVSAQDIIAADLITTSGVGYIDFQLNCQ